MTVNDFTTTFKTNNSTTNSTIRNGGLDIGIIGAGIAGLGTAIALRRSGHRVEIFERSKFKQEVGAAIHVCPNATRILNQWGFDFTRAKAVVSEGMSCMNDDTLEVTYSHRCQNTVGEFGAEWYFLHRVDLHSELRRLAELPENEGGEGIPAKIRLDSQVSDTTDIDSGIIRLMDGAEFKKDLIIAADGVHSLFATIVTGAPNPATHSGHSAFRFLIPSSTLLSDPTTAPLFPSTGTMSVAIGGSDRRLIIYPCRDNAIQNCAVIYRVKSRAGDHEEGDEDWANDPSTQTGNATGRLQNALMEIYSNAHPILLSIFQKGENIKLWPLLFRAPLTTWHKGKCVLIGDAAHPMLPHQAQAGAQALEDAAALGVVLSNLRSLEEIPKRLGLFEKVRMPRASAMQYLSNAGYDVLDDEMRRKAQMYIDGKVPESPEEFREWNFGYDITRESRRALSESLGK